MNKESRIVDKPKDFRDVVRRVKRQLEKNGLKPQADLMKYIEQRAKGGVGVRDLLWMFGIRVIIASDLLDIAKELTASERVAMPFKMKMDEGFVKSAERLKRIGGRWQSKSQGEGALRKFSTLSDSTEYFSTVRNDWMGKAIGMVHTEFSKANAKGFQSADGYVFDSEGVVAHYYLWRKIFGGSFSEVIDNWDEQRLMDIYDDFGGKKRNMPKEILDEVKDLERKTRKPTRQPQQTLKVGAKKKWERR